MGVSFPETEELHPVTRDDLTDPDFVDLLPSGLLVPHYLIACYLYYEAASPILGDRQFDELAARLDREWAIVSHPNKRLIDRSALKSGGSYLRGKYPRRVRSAAAQLAGQS